MNVTQISSTLGRQVCKLLPGALCSCVLLLSLSNALALQVVTVKSATSVATIASKTRGCVTRDGLLTFHVDAKRGRVWLETPPADVVSGEIGRYLYVEGLTTGLGANDVGLDRNQIGPTRLVSLRQVGGRLLVEAINYDYRALSTAPAEQRAVRESFATSVLWAGKVEAQDGDGRALVDFTSFIIRDAHGVAARLKRTDQGDFKLVRDRSVVDLKQCLAFVDNLEFEALLTFPPRNRAVMFARRHPFRNPSR